MESIFHTLKEIFISFQNNLKIKKLLLLILFLGVISGAYRAYQYLSRGRCNPNGVCHACKDCSACKHCAVHGGKCSVCR